MYYNYSQTEKCFQFENQTDAHGLHGWDWQTCTEMVMPLTVSSESMFPPYSLTYKDYADNCMRKYGVSPREHWITTEFGGNYKKFFIFNISGIRKPNVGYKKLVQECRELLHLPWNVEFRKIARDANQVADRLTKVELDGRVREVFWETPPNIVLSLLHMDVA